MQVVGEPDRPESPQLRRVIALPRDPILRRVFLARDLSR